MISEENYKDLMICFSRYVLSKSIKMLSLHCHEWMIEEHEEKKKYLVVDNFMLDKVLDKIKEIIGIE